MYAHIQLGVSDLDRMASFYDAVLRPLGLVRVTPLERTGPAGLVWQRPGSRWPQFVIRRPWNGQPPTTANGSQVSFLARSQQAVDDAWAAAMALSATDAGGPGLRPRYAPDFYAAYCHDPEGHKLCFVHTG